MSVGNELDTQATPTRNTKGVAAILSAIASVSILILLLFVLFFTNFGRSSSSALTANVKENRYQAVYLTDGQAYFGKVRRAGGDWIWVKKAHYLRNVSGDRASQTKHPDAKTELVPASQTVNGSDDILVNSREVIVIQDLKASAQISTMIEDAN